MNDVIKLFTVLSPFISAYIVYLLGIKGKRKDTDFQKEKELNVVLSNLLLTWSYFSQIKKLVDLLRLKNPESIIPRKHFSFMLINTGILNDGCFDQLENSIEVLKKYDPILFFQLEGIGNTSDSIRQKFILPILNNASLSQEELIPIETNLNILLSDFESYMKDVAAEINKDLLLKVKDYIQTRSESDVNEIIKKINSSYFEMLVQMMPENLRKMSLDEFMDTLKTDDEFKKMIEVQFDLIASNTISEIIDFVQANPNLSLHEIQMELERRKTMAAHNSQ